MRHNLLPDQSPETSAAIESAFAKGCSEVKYTSGKQTYTTLLPPLGSDTAKQTNDSSGTVRELRRMLIEDPVQIPKVRFMHIDDMHLADLAGVDDKAAGSRGQVARDRGALPLGNRPDSESAALGRGERVVLQFHHMWPQVVGPGSFNLGTVQRVFAVINPALADGFALKKAEMQRRAARNKTRLQGLRSKSTVLPRQ